MKRFKKIYVEITNKCNLACSFCTLNKRKINELSNEQLDILINKLEPYTDYLYLHVLGEPTMHSNINKVIDKLSTKFNINITTNGYKINLLKDNLNIRQINISLHSFDPKYNISLEEYMNNIINSIEKLKKYTMISLRLWTNNKYSKEIIEILNNKYNKEYDYNLEKNNYKLDTNIYLNKSNEFVWPNLKNKLNEETGKCYALKDHIAILVDGTIVPCCLDGDGIINLGNIYHDEIKDVIESERFNNMLEGFKQNKKCENLCKHCKFLNRD